MQFKILTKTMQDMINKVTKGAGNNKLLPLTSMIDINLENEVLSFTTTDMNNYFTVKETGIKGDNFNVVIPIDTFSKLVQKTTTDTITIELNDTNIKFTGNGTYNLPIAVDEEGLGVKFPQYSFPAEFDTDTIKLSDIRKVIENNSSCLSTDMSTPCLTGYYFDNNTISTDSIAICINKSKIFNKAVLLSPIVINLLGLFDKEDITVQTALNKIKFITPNIILCATIMEDVEDYPAEAIEGYLDAEFSNSCKINKSTLIGVLDRMLIFIDENRDNFSGTLIFSDKGLLIRNKDNTASELIPYVTNSLTGITGPYECNINISILKSQISSCSDENVNIYFGHDICIKLESENIVKIIALTEDDTEEDYEDNVEEENKNSDEVEE